MTGMAGGMGGGFSAPLFAAVLASELSPTSKRNYVAAFIPELFASTIGFVIYFGVTGSSMLGSYSLPTYELSLIPSDYWCPAGCCGCVRTHSLFSHQQAGLCSNGMDQQSFCTWCCRWCIGWPDLICSSSGSDFRKQTTGDRTSDFRDYRGGSYRCDLDRQNVCHCNQSIKRILGWRCFPLHLSWWNSGTLGAQHFP